VPVFVVIPAPIVYSKIVAIKTLVVSPDDFCMDAVAQHVYSQEHFPVG